MMMSFKKIIIIQIKITPFFAPFVVDFLTTKGTNDAKDKQIEIRLFNNLTSSAGEYPILKHSDFRDMKDVAHNLFSKFGIN